MQRWNPEGYSVALARDSRLHADQIEAIYHRAWRFDFTAPGFCLIDLGPGVDSHSLRAWMLELKDKLSQFNLERTGKPFLFRTMARFDQQETTRFHRDGAPDQSLLLLGYEPSRVVSRLFLADHSHCVLEMDISPAEFLKDYNPMFRKNEEILARYITELPQPGSAHARILLINNSSLPFTEDRTNPLGVLHMAEIVNPTKTEQRIVNSIMLATEGEEVGADQQQEFATIDKISQRVY